MRIKSSLVIVLLVNEDCVFAFELECQAPVSADADRPVILETFGQRMKFPSRSVHVAGLPGIIERKQLQAQLAGMLRLNPSFRSGAKEFLDAPMTEALDHSV